MENKIAIGTLAGTLATATGKSRKFCEEFLKEFFRLIEEQLEKGEQVKIKGFGTFRVVDVEGRTGVNVNNGERQELPSYKKVSFTPAKELSDTINLPFADFNSVEIDDDMPVELFEQETEDTIDKFPSTIELSDEDKVSEYRLEEGSEEEGEDDEITYEAYQEMSKEPVAPVYTPIATPTQDMEEEEEHEEPEKPSRSRFGIGFLTGSLCSLLVCVVIFMLGCFFDWWPVNFGSSKEIVQQQPELVEPEQEVFEEPVEEPEPVYDTVSTTRYLTTIAREHYGNFNFWPYIYMENESILGHPDRITPGTRVVVPPLSKYGVDPENKEDVAVAKQKGLEIYARYK